MASRRVKGDEEPRARRAPAATPEARENQLIALAVDLAAKQLEDGSASAQVISHYLKMGTERERLEREKLRRENYLLGAKAEQLESAQRMEELYANAILAMRGYSGQGELNPSMPEEDYDA